MVVSFGGERETPERTRTELHCEIFNFILNSGPNGLGQSKNLPRAAPVTFRRV